MRTPEEHTTDAIRFIKMMDEITSAIRAAMMEAWEEGAIRGGMMPDTARKFASKAMGYDNHTLGEKDIVHGC